MKRNYVRQVERKKRGLGTRYGFNSYDIGNIEDYKAFVIEQKKIFEGVHEVLRNRGYLVVITNNIFFQGRLYPLAFDTFTSLSERWVPKDERIWLQNDKALLPFGLYNAWVGNRHHQYCLIFRKEENKHEKTD